MNFYWTRSNNFLLVALAVATTIVGVLTVLVIQQQHDQTAVGGQVRLGTVSTAPAASVPAGADVVANRNAVTHPEPATTPDPANAPVGPASQLAPAVSAPPVAPAPIASALVAPAPPIVTPPRLASSFWKPLKTHRRVGPVPAPLPSAPVQPVTPAPQTGSDTPVKPGSPDGNW